ncbi:MAG: YicC family protein [Clostridia bacterium]|nr:YicC family protein [Clostridia bacterium]
MAVSMTGYGRSVLDKGEISIKVEIKSVNSRYLDINFKCTRGLSFTEEKVRSMLKDRIERGKIDIYVGIRGEYADKKIVNLDENAAASYIEAFTTLKKKFKLRGRADLAMVASIPGLFTVEEQEPEEEMLAPFITSVVRSAIDNLMEMKETEGRAIEKDMLVKISEMNQIVKDIEMYSEGSTAAYTQKLKDRIQELTEETAVDESRLAQEVAYFADRSCIDEEITRLKSHVSQFEENLPKRSIGRKLDFIIQEMNREANTIASKSVSIELTNSSIDLKNLVEKLREQAQNIE